MSNNISFNPLAWAIRPLYEKAIAEDALFAKEVKEKEGRKEKPKSLAECADYIYGEAYEWASNHRQGNMGFAGLPDSEVENLIKHYYDEDDIVIRKVENAVGKVASGNAPAKPKKAERPKETLEETRVPMVRPKDANEAKRESKKQAKAVEVPDMFAGMWDEPETKEDEDDLPE